jgi:hypothetical protein
MIMQNKAAAEFRLNPFDVFPHIAFTEIGFANMKRFQTAPEHLMYHLDLILN